VGTWNTDTSASLDYLIASVGGVLGNHLAVELEAFLGLRGIEVAPFAAYRGYTGAAALCNGGDRLVTVQWAVGRDPLVIAPGNISGAVAGYLKGRYEHQCSRKDAAVDFTDPDAFEVVAKLAIAMANERVSKTSLEGDWATPGAPCGRTLYVHSKKSPIFIRIYEHSKLHGGDVTCRVEVEVKPDKKPGKMQLAELDVIGVLGLSTFAIELLEKFGVSYERVPLAGYVRQLTDLQQRMVRLWMQYGRTLDEQLQVVGGDLAAFTSALFAARDDLDRRRAKAALAAARPKAVPLVCL
jgi:hypothetical protein